MKLKEQDAEGLLQQVAFGIWKCRNEAVFTGHHLMPNVAVDLWRQQVEEFRLAMVQNQGEQWGKEGLRGKGDGVGDTEEALGTWRKLRFGELKLNCDAAWWNDTGRGELGGCSETLLGFRRWREGWEGDVMRMQSWQRQTRFEKDWRPLW